MSNSGNSSSPHFNISQQRIAINEQYRTAFLEDCITSLEGVLVSPSHVTTILQEK